MHKREDIQYVLFGCGKNFYPYLERINEIVPITYFSDNNSQAISKIRNKKNFKGIQASKISELQTPYVIICVDSKESVEQIKKQFKKQKIPCCHAQEILNACDLAPRPITWPQKMHEDCVKKFIDIDLEETTTCNFRCKYCYVWRKKDFSQGLETSRYTVKDIRRGLAKERLGGTCFINLCARGETMLSKHIVELTYELLSEGHYVSIVTNGTIRKKIIEFLEFPEEFQERLFLKISFHYHELIDKNLMDVFWENVKDIGNSKCSYTLEITPYDDLVCDIEQIKQFFKEKEEAFPHISFARDIKKQDLDLLSNYSIEEYKKIWGQFDSNMFNLKSEWYGKKVDKFCYAGNWSYRINLANGSIQTCYRHESVGNIFDEELKVFPIKEIGHDCKMAYCFNNHAFLAWGCVPEISTYSYLDMRDRVRPDGKHWVSKRMKEAMCTKLGNENFQYANKWCDYEKLYQRTEKPAIVLFNSPDYRNIGDHAIALAEKKFFEKYFKGYDFIEVSCEQYQRENTIIKNLVRKDDIVAVTGGGNFGTLWLWIFDMTLNVINMFKENKILILPQSIYFEGSNFGARELLRAKKILEKHGRVTICLRDKKSYERMNNLFDKRVEKLLVPDMALFLEEKRVFGRSGIGVCLRNDKEKSDIRDEDVFNLIRAMGLEVNIFSTISDKDVFLNNREKAVEDLLTIVAKNKLVVTDRLHCLVFCVITKTPCVAFDNNYGKIAGVYEWIKELPYIELCDNISQLEYKVKKIIDSDTKYGLMEIRKHFGKFAVELMENNK